MQPLSKISVAWLFVTLASQGYGGGEKLENSVLNLGVPFLPETLDSLEVGSAIHHLILRHLTRPLVNLNKEGRVVGDLAESWEILEDHRVFRFKIRKAFWSDGTVIRARDVADSINRGKKQRKTVHSDFDQIEAVTVESDSALTIRLKEKSFNFLSTLRHPEMSLASTDGDAPVGQQSLMVTPGPFFLSGRKQGALVLKKNTFYDRSISDSPDTVLIKSVPADETLNVVANGSVDIIPSSVKSDIGDHDFLVKQAGMVPFTFHMGFSFWITCNVFTKQMKSLDNRRYVQSLLKPGVIDITSRSPVWTPSLQLYLPDNAGRPNQKWLDEFWNSLKPERPEGFPAKLSLLVSEDFPFTKKISEQFKAQGIELEITTYSTMGDFARESRKSYDLIQINNDFSSLDVMSNLLVTFGEARPLIFTEKSSRLKQLMKNLNSEIDLENRYPIYEEIAKEVLTGAYIAPIAYFNIVYYHRNNLDVSHWSRLFSDVSLWKVSIQKN